ncbi:hypothetical protein CCH79_00020662, partial [Gambusia affinis]
DLPIRLVLPAQSDLSFHCLVLQLLLELKNNNQTTAYRDSYLLQQVFQDCRVIQIQSRVSHQLHLHCVTEGETRTPEELVRTAGVQAVKAGFGGAFPGSDPVPLSSSRSLFSAPPCCCCCCTSGQPEMFSFSPERIRFSSRLSTILGEIRDEEDEILPRKDYESLDYDRCINEPYVEVLEGMDNKKARKYEAVRWVIVFVIGVTVGLLGLFVDFFVHLFTKIKFSVEVLLNCRLPAIEKCTDRGCLSLSLLELLTFNMLFVFIASVLVLIEVRFHSNRVLVGTYQQPRR